jgi:hypothetical protein
MGILFTAVEGRVGTQNLLSCAPESSHLQVTLTHQSCYNLEGNQQFQQLYKSSSYLEI